MAVFKRSYALALTFAAALPVSSDAALLTLLPGGSGALSGTTNAAEGGALGGTVIQDVLVPFQLTGGFGDYINGNVQTRVVDPSSGGLIFGIRLRDIATAASGVEFSVITGFSVSGFGGASVSTEYRTDGLGSDGPDSVTRNATGDLLTYVFDAPELDLTESSYFVQIVTDATEFQNTGTITIYGQEDAGSGKVDTVTLTGISVPKIPLPGGLALMGFGLAAIGFAARPRS